MDIICILTVRGFLTNFQNRSVHHLMDKKWYSHRNLQILNVFDTKFVVDVHIQSKKAGSRPNNKICKSMEKVVKLQLSMQVHLIGYHTYPSMHFSKVFLKVLMSLCGILEGFLTVFIKNGSILHQICVTNGIDPRISAT